ncbi:MAG: hypothetical protein EBX52_00875 [Proteobacteria bacterium]|nr:hypothetical protein [Pseudomonadota bacterium]
MNLKWIESEIVNSALYVSALEKIAKRDLRVSARSEELLFMLQDPDASAEKIVEWIKEPNSAFEPHKRIELDTGDKVRTLYTVSWPYRVVLIGLQDLMAKRMEGVYSTRLFSYRKGRGTFSAHRAFRDYLKNKKRVWVAKRDVTGFGDSIVQSILYETLERHFPRSSLPRFYHLLDQAIAPEFLDSSGQVQKLETGIPSGSPLTPILENIYLLELDERLTAICAADPSFFYARYGDDFVIACTDPVKFQKTVADADAFVGSVGLTYSEKKKVDVQLGGGTRYLEWLGAAFSCRGKIGPRPKHFRAGYGLFIEAFSGMLGELSGKLGDYSTVRPLLQTALKQFLSESTNPMLTKILLNRNDPETAKTMDYNVRMYLVRWLHREFKMGKSNAWREIRKLDIPSLNHQRRRRWRL